MVLRASALGALLAALLHPCAFALNPALDISQYAHQVWRVRDGFTKGIITSIAQTPDGYLWLGTEMGLLHFDGVRAVPWQPQTGKQLPGTLITSLLATRDGTLWIGTMKGLAAWKDAKLTEVPELAGRSITSLLQTSDGALWVGIYGDAGGTLCDIQSRLVHCDHETNRLGTGVKALYEDSKGTLWLGVSNGIWRWKPGASEFFSIPGEPFGIISLAEDEKGQLLFGSHAGIRRLVNGHVEPYQSSVSTSGWQVTRMLRDHDSALWVGTSEHGLVHINEQGRTDVFFQPDGLSGDYVTHVFEDREGSIWVATFDGIDRFRAYAIPSITTSQGLSSAVAWSILASKDGSVWIGTNTALNHWKNGQISLLGSRGGKEKSDGKLNRHLPNALFQDSGGRIWASNDHGELGYLQDDRFIRINGLAGGIVHSIAEVPLGHLWVSNQEGGLFHVFREQVVEHIPWATLGRRDFAKVLVADPSQHGLWIGFQGGGVGYFADGTIQASYSAKKGLSEGEVTDLRFGAREALWVATDTGLSRIKDGNVTTLTTRNGLPCDKLVATIEDNDHSMWLNLACGLARITQAELDAWVADPNRVVKIELFETSDGVRSHAAAGGYAPLMTKSLDGRIWFLPWDGVSVVDPHHIPSNRVPPPVHIEKIVSDRETRWQNLSGAAALNLRLPKLSRDLQIDYTALSFVAPEKVRFKYKLEGHDSEWTDAGTRRQAFYNDLPPRNYRFRVIASNDSGVWNEAGDTVAFSIAPAYYQANWFRALVVVAFLTFLAGLYRLRLLYLVRQFNARLEGRVSERTRVARDLHDTLLQSFQGVLLKFSTVPYIIRSRPDEAEEMLKGYIDQARAAITEGRDAVQGLRSSTVVSNDLARAITTFGEGLTTDHAGPDCPEFRVFVEGKPKNLPPLVRDEVYKIACECLRNGFRHARAKRIEVQIRYDQRQFWLQIMDNGKGIDGAILSAGGRVGHHGLPGLHERAQVAGGKLSVWSQVNSGTEIELTIPGSIAYTKLPASKSVSAGRK